MSSARLPQLLLSAAMLLSLAACGPKEPPASSSSDISQPAASVSAPIPEPEPVPQAKPEPEPEPVPAVLPYVNPLTGEPCAEDISQNRPVAIMLNNLKKALPQLGVSQADIIYEIVAEGGITRMMGLFQSTEGVGQLGSVRSARDYYVSLAYGHDAIFMHAGGSPQAYQKIKEWGVTALDCVNGPYERTLFWRDKDRIRNAGTEHSVLTSGDKIQELFPTYSYLRTEHKDGYTCPLQFSENAAPAGGEQAENITIKFSNYKTGVFRYDGDSGKYFVEEYGKPYVDGNTGEQVSVKNVLILNTDVHSIKGDTAGRQSVRTTGEGTGLFACGGKIEKITWSKPRHSQPMTFRTADGGELKLGIGTSYINVIGTQSSYSYE